MFKVIGIKERSGTLDNGNPWTSIDVYYQDLEPINSKGVIVEKVTFSARNFDEMCKQKGITQDKLLGVEFSQIYFNRNQKPVAIV